MTDTQDLDQRPPAGGPPTSGPDEDLVTTYDRSPADVLRLILFALTAVVVTVATKYLPDGVDGVEGNLVELLTVPTTWLANTLGLLLFAIVIVAGLAVLVIPLATRSWRVFGYVLAANFLANVVTLGVNAWVDLSRTGLGTEEGLSTGTSLDLQAGDVVNTTQMVAAFFAIAPFVSRRWRRIGGWIIALVLLLRLVVATDESTHAMLLLSVGATVGTATLVAFGRPTTKPTSQAIVSALRRSGLPVATIRPASVDARGSVPWFAELDDGAGIFVKVLGTDQRAADLLFRFYRMIRLKNVGDERPFSSLRRTVEHEALLALAARDVGVRTPRLRCVADIGTDAFLLAYDLVAGSSVDTAEPEEITDEFLRGVWDQVGLLRTHRIAHRDLRLANVFRAADGDPWIIDFGFSELAAGDSLLTADVAQLMASSAVVVGAERAVAPAIAALGPEAVAASLTRLQPAALSGSTQSALKEHKDLLEQLKTEVEQRCGVEEPELEPVTRIGGRQVFSVVMLVAVFYFLIPQLADLPGVVDQVTEANWAWFLPVLLAAAGSYMAAGLGIVGSVPDRIRYGPTFLAQVASSFASKVAPAGLGGMALNVRYLQRSGVDTAVATSSVGVNAVAGILCHVALIIVFLSVAGREAFGDLSLPSPRAFLIGVGVVALLAVVALAVPATRKLITEKLFPILARAAEGLRDVLTSPTKLLLLLGGSTLVTFTNGVAFYFAGRAFGMDLAFASAVAVYLVGSAVATAAPTPGGLGAVEAALVGGLVATGVDNEVAVPTVFLFRIGTFWLPILPGWLSFGWLRRTDHI